jgi:hypothetical protein
LPQFPLALAVLPQNFHEFAWSFAGARTQEFEPDLSILFVDAWVITQQDQDSTLRGLPGAQSHQSISGPDGRTISQLQGLGIASYQAQGFGKTEKLSFGKCLGRYRFLNLQLVPRQNCWKLS